MAWICWLSYSLQATTSGQGEEIMKINTSIIFHSRQLIRLTWGSERSLGTLQGRQARVVFSLGRFNNQTLQQMIEEESEK